MRVNPFYDSWLFLIGEDAFHLGIGPWRYLLVAIYWALAIASVYLAYRNWQPIQPSERRPIWAHGWPARLLGPCGSRVACGSSPFLRTVLSIGWSRKASMPHGASTRTLSHLCFCLDLLL